MNYAMSDYGRGQSVKLKQVSIAYRLIYHDALQYAGVYSNVAKYI